MCEEPPADGGAALLPATPAASIVRPSAGAFADSAVTATPEAARASAGDSVPLLGFEEQEPAAAAPSSAPQEEVDEDDLMTQLLRRASSDFDVESASLVQQAVGLAAPWEADAHPAAASLVPAGQFDGSIGGAVAAASPPQAPSDGVPDLLDDLAESPTRVPVDPAEVTPAIPPIPYTAPLVAAPSSPKYANLFAPPGRGGSGGAWSRAEEFLGRQIKLPDIPADIDSELGRARWLFGQRRAAAALELLPVGLDADSSDVALLRLRCLVALRRYQEVGEELARATAVLGDALPFEARVLSAQLPLFMSPADPLHAMGLLQELARQSQQGMLRGVSRGERLHLLQRLSHAALAACHSSVAADEILAAAKEASGEDVCELYVLLGRHHAAVGNVHAAAEALELASGAGRDQAGTAAHLDAGFLATARGEHSEGSSHFRAAAEAGAKAVSAMGAPPDAHAMVVDEVVTAETNLSVCQLYVKELTEGVKRLEAFVKKDPALHLRPCVARTLSGLYEFLPDAQLRRSVIRELVEAFNLDDIESRTLDQS